ncbi:MAG: formate dehydrogenase subunit alpha [Dehalococcoidia bacterium]
MKYRTVSTTCVYCGCGCGLYLEVLDDELVGTLPCKTHPINEGGLCVKGWSAHEFVTSEKRLRRPLVKKDGHFIEVDWGQAMGRAAAGLARIKEERGPQSLALLSSAKCTNEENFLLMKLARGVLGTNNIDHCARLCHAPTVAGLAQSFGSGAMTNSTPEIEEADCILVTGSNTTEAHPLIASRILRAKEKGAKLIVVDPRGIQLSSYADIQVRQRLGTDVAWINGVMNIIISQGWHDRDFIQRRTEGFAELEAKVREYTPQRVEQITAIPQAELRRMAETYAKAQRASIIYAMGITQQTSGTDNVLSLSNLALLTGNVGKRGSGVNPLRGHNNVQGACDMGCLPNVLSGYQSVASDELRGRFEEQWRAKLPREPGLTVVEMMQAAAEGQIRAMFIMAENPLLSDPDIHHVSKALQGLDLLVVQDIFLTETAALADVVLPGVSFAEKDGTFTATDRRVQRVRKAIEPLGEAKPDWQIICELAQAMGGKGFQYKSAEEVFEEMARLTPIYAGITYPRIEERGLQWPCRSAEDPGTEFLHGKEFTRGLGKFVAVDFREPAEIADEEYPLLLTTGRSAFQFHTGTLTRKSPSLRHELDECFLEINPLDAGELGVAEGEVVRVSSRRGEIEVKAKLTDKIEKGTLFVPFHFAESAANALTNSALDPVAKIPEFKVCAVRVEKLKQGGK